MPETVYLIKKDCHIIGYVETEEIAKHIIGELNKNNPYNPISDADFPAFKKALDLWENINKSLCNPDCPADYSLEIEFFQSDKTPFKVSPENIIMYHRWNDYYQSANDYPVYYEPCKKFENFS